MMLMIAQTFIRGFYCFIQLFSSLQIAAGLLKMTITLPIILFSQIKQNSSPKFLKVHDS